PGEVERQFHAEAPRLGVEGVEVLERAERGLDGGVAAGCRADRPGAARILRPGDERIVAPLPEAGPDWMDRRQIDDVETEIGDARQLGARVAEGAAPARIGAGRAREHLVPRAEAGALAID